MRFVAASFIHILTILCAVSAFGAEEITHISVIQADTGRETALQRRLPVGITHPKIGDRVVLHAGKSGNYIVEVTESRRSKFGNSIVHGVTPSGGSSLLVFSPAGSVTGNLYAYDGKVQITTEKEVTTAWRMGIDALAIPIDDGGIAPSNEELVEPPVTPEIGDRTEYQRRPSNAPQSKSGEYILPSFKVGPHVIDVLMYYDESLSDASSIVDYTIELTNEALKNSEISATVSVVAMKPVTVSPSDSNRDLIDKLDGSLAPFEAVEADRRDERADLVILLRGDRVDDGTYNCGFANYGFYDGKVVQSAYTGVVEWRPEQTGRYCLDLSMAHEIGHLLGAQHDRGDYESDRLHGATSYAYAYAYASSVSTIMMPVAGDDGFSNPELTCKGMPCGSAEPDPSGLSSGANNARAFRLTTASVAGKEGEEFSFDSTFVFASETSECEKDGETGIFEGIYLRNNHHADLHIAEGHWIRENGSARAFTYDKGEIVISPGYSSGRGWCGTESDPSPVGEEFVEAFFRYYHPDTDQLVETGHVYFEDDYDGEYSVIRVATSSGGSVIGHPEQHVRVGARHIVSLVPDPFYKLDRIVTNCEGEDRGDNTYLVEVSEDDCRIEAFFKDGGFDVRVQYHFNSLLNSVQDTLSGRNPSGEAACDGACD